MFLASCEMERWGVVESWAVWYTVDMKKILLMCAMVMMIWVGVPSNALAASNCEKTLLGLRPWYHGLLDSNCELDTPKNDSEVTPFVWKIILNILVDLFSIVGYLAIGFVIYGGYLYILSDGDPGKAAKGKKTITYAVTGIIISILASLIVNFILSVLTPTAV